MRAPRACRRACPQVVPLASGGCVLAAARDLRADEPLLLNYGPLRQDAARPAPLPTAARPACLHVCLEVSQLRQARSRTARRLLMLHTPPHSVACAATTSS